MKDIPWTSRDDRFIRGNEDGSIVVLSETPPFSQKQEPDRGTMFPLGPVPVPDEEFCLKILSFWFPCYLRNLKVNENRNLFTYTPQFTSSRYYGVP